MDLIQIIHKGAIATYPLIFMSALNSAIVLERLWSLRNLRPLTLRLSESILKQLSKGQKEMAVVLCKQNSHSPSARIFLNCLTNHNPEGLEKMSAFATESIFEEVQKLKKNLWIVGTVASSSPFIGLLGTVIGIIKSFESMAVVGTGGFSVVAAGISEALVATALGLAVAILALIFYNYFQVRITDLGSLFRIETTKILQELIS